MFLVNNMEFLKKNRKLVIGLVIVLLALLTIFSVIVIKKSNNKNELTNIEKEITEASKDIYENYYYNMITQSGKDTKTFFEGYTKSGIRLTLDNLIQYKNDDKFKKIFADKCDFKDTKIAIFPKEPYKKGDYEIKIDLDCK